MYFCILLSGRRHGERKDGPTVAETRILTNTLTQIVMTLYIVEYIVVMFPSSTIMHILGRRSSHHWCGWQF